MKELFAIISPIISGAFMLVSGVLYWRMKRNLVEFNREAAIKEKNLAEKKQLYLDIQTSFEKTLYQVLARRKVATIDPPYEVNAKVRLFAPNQIFELYMECCELLKQWSALYEKAMPEQLDLGDTKVTIYQAPDPTAKYKEPAKKAHEKLQDKLAELIKEMKHDVNQ